MKHDDSSVPPELRATEPEILEILEREAETLPPESHEAPPTLVLATRTPGKGRLGKLSVAAMVIFTLVTGWQWVR